MRILLTKIDNAQHALEIVRKDGSRDRAELETKSLLVHDFLHFAVESEAGLQDGFWGAKAAGKAYSEELVLIEQIVGAMSLAAKGRTAKEMMEGFRNFALAKGEALPGWLTAEFIERVQERIRRLVGHWNGTPFGATMEIEWEES